MAFFKATSDLFLHPNHVLCISYLLHDGSLVWFISIKHIVSFSLLLNSLVPLAFFSHFSLEFQFFYISFFIGCVVWLIIRDALCVFFTWYQVIFMGVWQPRSVVTTIETKAIFFTTAYFSAFRPFLFWSDFLISFVWLLQLLLPGTTSWIPLLKIVIILNLITTASLITWSSIEESKSKITLLLDSFDVDVYNGVLNVFTWWLIRAFFIVLVWLRHWFNWLTLTFRGVVRSFVHLVFFFFSFLAYWSTFFILVHFLPFVTLLPFLNLLGVLRCSGLGALVDHIGWSFADSSESSLNLRWLSLITCLLLVLILRWSLFFFTYHFWFITSRHRLIRNVIIRIFIRRVGKLLLSSLGINALNFILIVFFFILLRKLFSFVNLLLIRNLLILLVLVYIRLIFKSSIILILLRIFLLFIRILLIGK